jgi:hypothetical protein
MPNWQPYCSDHAERLPVGVKDGLGTDHLCFLVQEAVESLDLSGLQNQEVVNGAVFWSPAGSHSIAG